MRIHWPSFVAVLMMFGLAMAVGWIVTQRPPMCRCDAVEADDA